MKSMKRQKLEPGSLHIVYPFQHQLTFTSGLGNHKKLYLSMYDFPAETRNYSIFLAFIASSFRVTEED